MTLYDVLLLAGLLLSVGSLLYYRAARQETQRAWATSILEYAKKITAANGRALAGEQAATAAAAERDTVTTAMADLQEQHDRLLESTKIVVPAEALTPAQLAELMQNLCAHCGGVHTQACPRVKRLRFGTDGSRVEEVEFWPDGRWDQSRVKWIEDLPPVAAPE